MSYQNYPPPNQYGPPPGQYQQQPFYGQPGQQQQYPPNQAPPPQGYPPAAGAASSYYGGSQPVQQQPPSTPFQQPPGYPPQPPAGVYNDSRAYPMGPQSYNQPPYGGHPPGGAYGQGQQQFGQGYPPQQPPYGAALNQYPPQQYPPQQQIPPQQQPMQQYYGQPSKPSPGYELPPIMNPMEFTRQADDLRKAMKGFGTNEGSLIRILTQLSTPYMVLSTTAAFNQRHNRDLIKDIQKETSGHFEDGLVALARGPLLNDVYALHSAIHRPGTSESLLNDVLLSRSNADMNAITQLYNTTFHRSLEADVRGDLSLKTEDMFVLVLRAGRNDDSMPVDTQQIEKDVYNIHFALEGGRFGVDQATIYSTILTRNDAQIAAIVGGYQRMYNRDLEGVIEKKFSGHMKDALLYAIRGGTNKPLRDAMLLEDTMKGAGTKDILLVYRLVKYHWNRPHLENVKQAYHHKYNRTLESAVKSETSGDYEKLLVAVITGGHY